MQDRQQSAIYRALRAANKTDFRLPVCPGSIMSLPRIAVIIATAAIPLSITPLTSGVPGAVRSLTGLLSAPHHSAFSPVAPGTLGVRN